MKPRILTSALVGVLMFLSAGLAAASPASAAATAGADRTIHYQGATFRVPASWPVVDLDRAPNTCVRFDRHAVYLGRSGARQDCPAHLMGRTEAILVQPAGHGAAPAAQENTSAREITVSTAELTVTASYGTDRATVQAVLDSAGLPRVRRTQPRSATPAAPAVAAAAISASTTSYTGKGFDLCQAPDSSTMGTWKASSPYGAIGIYLGGVNRTCDQPNLTSGWVAQQASIGWHFIPLYVGYQAPGACQNTCTAIPSPSQGTADAEDAIAQLSALGFPAGSPVYMDIEPYSPASYSSLVMGYLSAWTTQLHARGYLSGVYGNGSGVISDLVANYGSATMPDLIDFAIWPGSGSTSTSDPTIPDNEWANHQRIHQYAGDITETYGGISLGIDSDYLDVQQAGPGSGWDDFGDGRQNPAIGREANGAMIAFAVSPDQQGLYYREQSAPNGGWGTWQQLGGAVGGLPVVGRDPDGRLELFVLGPGKSSIQHIWQTAPGGGWSSWDPNFGGPAAGLTVGQNADGRLEVFALAPGGANISHIWQTAPNGGWSSWDATFGGPAGG
ncbi:hypothetical protein ABH930_006887, partial [Kitasatospora sp. GAS204A]|uniref:glycoside hydrolase domain-containing protein n=1 Tax=unclassified Kitasatospora TaxID=2633591 RepID=UPI0024753D66